MNRLQGVTEVFIYLASDESRNVNGQRFQVQEENWGQQVETPVLV